MGGAGGAIDLRFIRRASVGLIVRAPSPVACGGTTDILLEDEEGLVGCSLFLPGERAALVEEDLV